MANPITKLFKRKEKITEVTVQPPSVSPETVVKNLVTSTQNVVSSTDVATADESSLITLYRQMENDSIISAALDLYADNATQINTKTKHVVSVESSNQAFKEEINDFLWNVAKLDTDAWQIVRDIARDGKIFLDTKASNNGRDWSFIPVQDPSKVKALTYGQDTIKYYAVAPEIKEEQDTFFSIAIDKDKDKADNTSDYKIASHDRYIAGFATRQILGKMTVSTESSLAGPQTEELFIRGGRSFLASVVGTWEILTAMENAMFVNRLTKSTQFKLVHIDVSDSNNKQAEQIINAVKNAFKASESIDQTTNKYQNRQSPIPTEDLVYIPVKGEKGAVRVETVGGDIGEVKTNDIDYYRNRLFAGLSVPKAYLGFEETTPGGLGDSMLTKLDERFGRSVVRLQKSLTSVVNQMIDYYWINSTVSRSLDDMPDYTVVLGEVSTKEREAAMQHLTESINVANNIISLARDELFADFISREKLFKYIFNDIIGIDTAVFDNKAEPEKVPIKIKKYALVEKHNPKHENSTKLEHSHLVKIKDVLSNKDNLKALSKLLSETPLLFEDENGTVKTLSEALRRRGYQNLLNEYTYKQLKDMSKTTDPERLKKAKKLNARYIGLDKDSNIVFTVTAEDPAKNKAEGKPTSYITRINLKSLDYVIKANEEDGRQLLDRDIVRLALEGDLAVSCSCPASTWWGQQYKGTKEKYSIDKNEIAPKRNLPLQTVCKHTLITLTALPFWNNSIVKDLRDAGLITKVDKTSKKLSKLKDTKALKELEEEH